MRISKVLLICVFTDYFCHCSSDLISTRSPDSDPGSITHHTISRLMAAALGTVLVPTISGPGTSHPTPLFPATMWGHAYLVRDRLHILRRSLHDSK